MEMPLIRFESTSINVAGVYIPVGAKCECGKIGVTIACFLIQEGDHGALILCPECAVDFAIVEAGHEFILVSIAEVMEIAKERKKLAVMGKIGRPTKAEYNPQKILPWLAAKIHPATAQELSDQFGSDCRSFRALMNRWTKKGFIQKVITPSQHKNQRPGVGYRVADATQCY